MDGFIDGAKAMIVAVAILILAWSLSSVCKNLGTAEFLIEVSRDVLSARLLPLVVFVLAAPGPSVSGVALKRSQTRPRGWAATSATERPSRAANSAVVKLVAPRRPGSNAVNTFLTFHGSRPTRVICSG